MKRFTTLVLALCLTFGAVSQASALEVVPSGVMDFVFVYDSGYGFEDDAEFDRFHARQRSRIQVDFIANENLRGVMMLQFGTWDWGQGGAALDTTSDSAKVRRLYLDFNFPDSPVNMKMGLMDLVLPYATFGQPVFGNHVAAVTMSADISDNASLTAFWARPLRGDSSTKDNDMDVFGLWANLDFDSFTVAPWVAYASIGNNSGWYGREFGIDNYIDVDLSGNGTAMAVESDTADWWGAGLALTVNPTDALSIRFDAMYAKLSSEGRYAAAVVTGGTPGTPTVSDMPDADGYYFALAVDYAFDWGTLGVFGIYSSGNDADDDDIGRIPGLGYDDNVWATRMAFAGSMTCGYDSYISATGIGLWMVGVQLADLSFIENVNHTARVAYISGTNHIDSDLGGYFGNLLPLTYNDKAWEVGFDTYWQMYENLTVGLELGYIYLDASDKHGRDEDYDREGVFNGNLIFRFGF